MSASRTWRSNAALVGLLGWVALAAATMVLALANAPRTGDLTPLDSVDFAYVLGFVVFTAVMSVVGALVGSRTGHVTGWLLIALAITVLVPLLLEQYAFYGLVTSPGGSLPFARVAAWAAQWTFLLAFPPAALVLLLFPTGTLPSRRWRGLVPAVLVSTVLNLGSALKPGVVEGPWRAYGLTFENPVGMEGVSGLGQSLSAVGGIALIGSFVAGLASVIIRYRRSVGLERLQIKWLALVALCAVLILVGALVGGRLATGTRLENAVGSISWGLMVTTFMLGLPLAIGTSILKYRLYDIDLVINKTLVYGALTGALAIVYGLLVVGLGALARSLGGNPDSPLVVAASTLTAAALFHPLRHRVQSFIDRRFYRRRYDARRALEAFSSSLRDEVDLDDLTSRLLAVVDGTIQPSQVSLWLRMRDGRAA